MLIAIIYVFYVGYGEKCMTEVGTTYRVQGDIQVLSQVVESYKSDTGLLPDSLNDLVGEYIKVLHSDPWGVDYHYEQQNGEFKIFTLGSDNKEGGIGSATDLSRDTDFDRLIEYIKEPIFGCNV